MRRATPPPELRRPNLAPPESRPAPTPTLRPPAAANVPRTTPFRLEGTLEIGSNVAALIGGEVYHVGDVVAGYKILAIGKNWVQCEGYPGYIEVSSAPIREPRLEHGQDARAVQSRE
ncbi:hypothetical protein HS125_20130 [bacterium]|nr:hypothetical protein [bacterium]